MSVNRIDAGQFGDRDLAVIEGLARLCVAAEDGGEAVCAVVTAVVSVKPVSGDPSVGFGVVLDGTLTEQHVLHVIAEALDEAIQKGHT